MKEKEICPAYISKINSVVISNHYLNDSKWRNKKLRLICCKKVSTLLHGITSKHKGDLYCLNCLFSFRSENKPKFNEKVWKIKTFVEL